MLPAHDLATRAWPFAPKLDLQATKAFGPKVMVPTASSLQNRHSQHSHLCAHAFNDIFR